VEIETLLPAFVAADRLVAFSIGLSSLYPSMICEPKYIICHSLTISPILSMDIKTEKRLSRKEEAIFDSFLSVSFYRQKGKT